MENPRSDTRLRLKRKEGKLTQWVLWPNETNTEPTSRAAKLRCFNSIFNAIARISNQFDVDSVPLQPLHGTFSSVASNDHIDPVFVHEIGHSGTLFSLDRFVLIYKRTDEINLIFIPMRCLYRDKNHAAAVDMAATIIPIWSSVAACLAYNAVAES
jgi:hypothetical protein